MPSMRRIAMFSSQPGARVGPLLDKIAMASNPNHMTIDLYLSIKVDIAEKRVLAVRDIDPFHNALQSEPSSYTAAAWS